MISHHDLDSSGFVRIYQGKHWDLQTVNSQTDNNLRTKSLIKFQKIVSRLFYAEIGAGESIMNNNPKPGATTSVGLTNTNKDLRDLRA